MICGRCIAWQLDTKVLAYMKARGMKKMLEVDFERIGISPLFERPIDGHA